MKKNMGNTDRMIRILVAVIIGILHWQGIIVAPFSYVLFAIAGIFILTSFVSFCPLYALVGLNTCKIDK